MSDMGPTAAQVRPRPISAAEYYRMGEVGILGPDERVELLNGRIITMPPIGPRHAQAVRTLTRIVVYTEPDGHRYRSRRTAVPGESVSPRAFPDVSIAVDDILT
jgi:Uma2 family endonuclease